MPSIISIEDNNDSRLLDVNEFLREFNQTTNPLFWQKYEQRENDPVTLNLVYLDNSNGIIAGLIAETAFLWLKIQIMAVHEKFRRKGIGKLLLSKAEQIGRQRNCKYSYVDSMEYQAPDFYLKQGYTKAGELPNWDSHGHSKIFFIKSLIHE